MSRRYVGLWINVIMLVVAAALYSHLPDRVPTHWNFEGDVDGTMPKFPGAFLPSIIAFALWFLLPVLRRIDPRRSSYEKFDATFFLIINLVCVMMALIQGLTLAVSLGMHVDIVRSMMLAVGVMFLVLGNYMPRIRSNWWMGIRTPWTLDNDEVWRRTHRFGGRMFVAAGLITMISTLLPSQASAMIAITATVIAGLTPVVYSYLVWRSEPSRDQRPDA
jgi:uncharacterized membrane protein